MHHGPPLLADHAVMLIHHIKHFVRILGHASTDKPRKGRVEIVRNFFWFVIDRHPCNR